MVSSGYGTEATVESIWETAWDTTQFGHINALIGDKFNFYIAKTATDFTNAVVVAILAASTNELFALWNSMVKEGHVTDPWNFIILWNEEHLTGDKFYERYSMIINDCKEILSKKIHVKSGPQFTQPTHAEGS